tara:strand:- start:3871 stop:5829 length:1959 start_codon:yes stop_codon:yes gene_type:complete
MGTIKLIDFIKISPDPTLVKLGKRQKHKLIDNLLSEPAGSNQRGLLITYDLSHSGRRINNRIYTTRGQQDGINTLLSPYPKPILAHHDEHSDPIGRFVGGHWDDLSHQAISFFDNVNDFMELQDAYEKDDPELIYDAMKKFGLLTNKKWPGLGRMRVQARITDEIAVEKFLDGRYVTFSAGSTTNRHVCSICQSDWADGDICEHRHGKIYDGDICVFTTGLFQVMEGSVVNMPADDLSQVLAMELIDAPEHESTISGTDCIVDDNTIYISDSVYHIKESLMSDNIAEAITQSDTEVAKLVSEEAPSESETIEHNQDASDVGSNEISNDVAEVAETESSDIKDSENVSSDKDEVSTEEEVTESVSLDSEVLERLISILNEMQEKAVEEACDGMEKTVRDESETKEEKAEEEASDESKEEQLLDEDIKNTDVDWYLLDAALMHELGDAKLSTAELEALDASVFCGPDRSFPVPDCSHADAARRLIGRAKLSTAQKAKVIDCVDRIAKNLDCNEDSDQANSLYEALKADHAVALKQVQELEDKLTVVLEAFAKSNNVVSDSDEDKLSFYVNWFDNMSTKVEEDSTEEISADAIENPSLASSTTPSIIRDKRLGSFEKSIVNRYHEILEISGKDAAEGYLVSKRRYLPRGFHPNKL